MPHLRLFLQTLSGLILYRVSHKKRNGGFSVACDLKVPYLFTSSNQATPAEENDTKIIKWFWFYGHLLKHSHFQISLDFCDQWAKDYVGNGLSLLCFGEAHWSVSTKESRFNRIPQSIIMKGYSRHNSSLIGRKKRAKFKNDRISRNGHRIKTTQPNLMILVSFSSAEDVWSNDVNKYNTFSPLCTENPPFRFLGHPVYFIDPRTQVYT